MSAEKLMMSELLVRDTDKEIGGLGAVESKGNQNESRENVTCNGDVVRTSAPLKNGSMIGANGETKDSFEVTCSEPLDTRWEGNEKAKTDLINSTKDPPPDSHTTDSTSSEDDETEGGAFAANWYVPLPQDPQQSDEEDEDEGEDGEEWSKGAAGVLQDPQGDEEPEGLPGQGTSASVGEVKPSAKMEDSHVEAIKKAMDGFSLPLGSQPQWAHVVPENVWKAELIGGLHKHKTSSKTKQKK